MPILSFDQTVSFAKEQKRLQKSLVLVTGVFDLLHSEHQLFLTKAKAAGDILIIGLESDQRVKRIKGHARPINPQEIRAKNLDKLRLADAIFILPEQFDQPTDHDRLIAALKPNILAVSSHTKHLESKQAILSKHGGIIKIVHPYNPAISTSKLLENKIHPS
jgi:rfaE bifunctional protein nucleotidyltransferase chain/domain